MQKYDAKASTRTTTRKRYETSIRLELRPFERKLSIVQTSSTSSSRERRPREKERDKSSALKREGYTMRWGVEYGTWGVVGMERKSEL